MTSTAYFGAPDFRNAGISVAFGAIWIAALWLTFEPSWWTSDDAVMSMRAHGNGVADVGSPVLIFSNIAWGGFVRLLPSSASLPGYSLATFLVLVIVSAAFYYAIVFATRSQLLAAVVTAAVTLRAALIPQFTVNAGLLMVAAIAMLLVYRTKPSLVYLHAGLGLGVTSYLVRDTEALLVLLAGAVFIPWRALVARWAPFISTLSALAVVAAATIANALALASPEWARWSEWNRVRLPFSDYGANLAALADPGALAMNDLSANDIRLVRTWFFADPELANPATFDALLRDINFGGPQSLDVPAALGELTILTAPPLLALFLLGATALLLRPSYRVGIAWAVLGAAIIGTALVGRPGVERVFVPVAVLLVIMPIMVGRSSRLSRAQMTAAALAFLAFIAVQTVPISLRFERQAIETAATYQGVTTDLLVTWGASFPSPSLFPVVGAPLLPDDLRLYGLDSTTLAPGTVVSEEAAAGVTIRELLTREGGVLVNADENLIALLDGYCTERLDLQLTTVQPLPANVLIWKATCS